MKLLHYCKVLLFSFPLNILMHNKNKSYITPKHTRNTRLLCECELYTSIYDDDPEMKKVLQDFDRQTSQRFKEYNGRMQEKRKNCKEQCDKDIQKIILKDKIEKQMEEKFSALETNIDSNDLPTCICNKTLADKVEKRCLKCTQNLGGVVAPSSGVLGGIAELGLSAWKTAALAAAKKAAITEGAVKGLAKVEAMGLTNFIKEMNSAFCLKELDVKLLETVFFQQKLDNFSKLAHSICVQCNDNYGLAVTRNSCAICNFDEALECTVFSSGAKYSDKATLLKEINSILSRSKDAAAFKAADITIEETTAIETAKKVAIETTCMYCHTAIIASIVAILKKEIEEKTAIYKIIKRINMFWYFDVGRKFGICIIFS
ncbi:PIR protein, putative [Plasmodium sp.]|nr:PIR protein, putative [Plasmodium sp.]